MKKPIPFILLICLAACPALSLQAQEVKRIGEGKNLSLKLEIQHHIDEGIKFLLSKQKEDGSWGDENYPALTALPLSAIMGNPERDPREILPKHAEKGYIYLLGKQKADGGIYGKGLGTYNTSLSMMALLHIGNQPEALETIRKARRFLINQQADWDQKGVADSEFDGGIGYGGSYSHSDLSNTHLAMEALYYSKQLLADRPGRNHHRAGLERRP